MTKVTTTEIVKALLEAQEKKMQALKEIVLIAINLLKQDIITEKERQAFIQSASATINE